MSDVADVRAEMRAFAEGMRCPEDLRARIHGWADRLERKPPIQKVAGVKRSEEQIDRDNLRVLEAKIAYPHLKLQELSDKAGMNNIGRVSECLNAAKEEFATYAEAHAALKEKIYLAYDRIHLMELDLVQIEALRFAKGKQGVGYFLEMGLGKTLLALEEFKRACWPEDEMLLPDATRLVVVAPNSFKQGWADEIQKHGFAYDAHVFVSGAKANEKWLSKKYTAPPVLIINYEAIRGPAVLLRIMAWMRVKPTMLVLDESIQIKTHDSAQTRAALALSKEAKIVRILTGLPQTQGPQDLYPQLRAIGLFPTQKFWAFRNWFCEMGGWENKVVVGVKHADELAKAMAPVVFQAKKRDWLPALPRKDFTIRTYEMTGEQRDQYRQMERDFILDMEKIEASDSDEVVTVRVAVSKYEKLSQIQCGFIIDNDQAVQELVEPGRNPRLNLLLDILDQIEGKAIVIYRHKAVFDLLSLWSGLDNPAFIKGGMTPDEVGAQKERFNDDSATRVLLGQCEATKYGHTLLGGKEDRNHCSTMIFFENSYSLDTRTQVEDRIHRRGQRGENVLYIDLAGTELDRRVVRALQKKEDLYKAVFSKLKAAAPIAIGSEVS